MPPPRPRPPNNAERLSSTMLSTTKATTTTMSTTTTAEEVTGKSISSLNHAPWCKEEKLRMKKSYVQSNSSVVLKIR